MIENAIANFTRDIQFESIPAEAVKTTKRAFLDYIGVALAACDEQIAKIVTKYAREAGTSPEAGIIGGGFKASATEAAFANGVIGHSLDYDDISLFAHLHASSTLVPVILALGQIHKISGKQAIEAYVIGSELQYRMGDQTGTDMLNRGFHPTAVIGSIGATLAAAKILKLTTDQVKMALGIAASEAGGLRINSGTMSKPFGAGNAVKSGIVAAYLAKNGFTSNQNALGETAGFFESFGGSKYDLEKMARGLGKDYYLISEGMGIKPYPSCFGTHGSIDSILYLRETHHIQPDDVAEIECATAPLLRSVLHYHNPKIGLEGKFSLEYCIARALVSGEVRLKHFADEQVSAPEVRKIIPKVKYVHPEELLKIKGTHPAEGEKITVRLKNGQSFSHQVSKPKGDPANPLSDKELIAKYRDSARLKLASKSVERSKELLLNLENAEDITELVDTVSMVT